MSWTATMRRPARRTVAVARSPDEEHRCRDVARAVLRPVLRRCRRPGGVGAAPPHRRAPLCRRRDRVQRGLLRDLVGVGQLRLVRQRPRLGRRPVPPAHPRADRRCAHPRRRHPRRPDRLRLHHDDDRLRRDAARARRDVAACRSRPAEPSTASDALRGRHHRRAGALAAAPGPARRPRASASPVSSSSPSSSWRSRSGPSAPRPVSSSTPGTSPSASACSPSSSSAR